MEDKMTETIVKNEALSEGTSKIIYSASTNRRTEFLSLLI